MTDATTRAFDCMSEFLQRLFSLAESDAMDLLIQMDVTFSQARTLFVLAHVGEPLPINEIAKRLNLSVAAAGRNVDHLVRLGIAERAESPDDRRVKLVSLSAQGIDIADAHVEQKRSALRIMLSRLDDADCTRLADVITPILEGDALATSTHSEGHRDCQPA